MTGHRPLSRWTAAAAVLLFAVHALNYFYFFVDDEAIPYVYAQNLLHGKGLVYNALEGRVEGYSDFLHVGVAAVSLATARAVRLPKLSVFFIGKGISIACGVGTLLVLWSTLRRLRIGNAAAMTALAFAALSPPLAVWSCSSLETVPYALTVMLLVAALIAETDALAALAAVLLVLERIDGFVFAGAFIGAFLLAADPPRRAVMLRSIAAPLAMAFVAYHGWRLWYFGDLLPAPLEAKILYKLKPHPNLVVKAPDESYLHRFVDMYGWPGTAALVAATLAAFRVGGAARRLLIALVPLVAYVSLVGDWMFGFRFFVPLVAPIALMLALAFNPVVGRRAALAAALAFVSTVYLGFMVSRFVAAFRAEEKVETFLASPSRDLHRFFWPYYGLYEAARRLIPPAEVIAYNQAGFIPFMLDVNNIDDLGICSRFYAELPTTDVYFTEVGRYVPLTNSGHLRAGQAYLLYEDARFVLARTDILARANGDTIPETLLGGYYQLVQLDVDRQNAVYRRTSKPAAEYLSNPYAFDENVAHVSYIQSASINDVRIPASDYRSRLKLLSNETSELVVRGSSEIAVQFASVDERVRAVTAQSIRVSAPATLTIMLLSADGHLVHREAFAIQAGQAIDIDSRVPDGARANALRIRISSAGDARAWVTDLRVLGQTPALERFIKTRLRFPASPPHVGR